MNACLINKFDLCTKISIQVKLYEILLGILKRYKRSGILSTFSLLLLGTIIKMSQLLFPCIFVILVMLLPCQLMMMLCELSPNQQLDKREHSTNGAEKQLSHHHMRKHFFDFDKQISIVFLIRVSICVWNTSCFFLNIFWTWDPTLALELCFSCIILLTFSVPQKYQYQNHVPHHMTPSRKISSLLTKILQSKSCQQ